MTNEEILTGMLDINYLKIIKSLTEVMGKEYKYQIMRIVREITFYGYGTNQNAIKCCQHAIQELLPELDRLTKLDPLEQLEEQDKYIYLKARIDTLNKIIDELEVKDISKKNELTVGNFLLNEEIDYLIASFPEKTQLLLKWSEDYREQLKNYIIFSNPDEDIKMTASYREFFGDMFSPLLHDSDDIMEFSEFKKIIEVIKTKKEIFRRANDPTLDALHNASSDRINRRLYGGNASKTDLVEMNDRFFNRFLLNSNFAGTHFGYGTLDGGIVSIIGLRLSEETNDIHIIHEIIHALSSFISEGIIQSGFNKDYRNFNEVVTQWLAQLVAKIYFDQFPPLFSKEDNCSYNSAVKAIENFLTLHKDDIIKALLEYDPDRFIEKIGKENMKEIDRILGNYIKFSDVDHFENPYLRDDALWLRQVDETAKEQLTPDQ